MASGPPHVKAKHVISVCRPTTAILVQDSMTKGLNSPDAKRPRGGRSPVPEDTDMTDKPQLKFPEARGALGRGSGGSGDRHSAPRAAPARRITALSPEELTQGFLLHEEQLALLQHQVSIVFKFPEDAPMARSLMQAVREWQAEHKAGTAHPWGSCAHYTAASLLKEHRRKTTTAVLSSHGSVFLSNCFVSSFFSRPVRNRVAAMAAWTVMDPAKEARAVLDAMAQSLLDDPSMPTPAPFQTPPADVLRALMSGNIAGQAIGKGNSSEVHACQSNPRFVIRTVRQQDEVEWQRELSRLRRVPALSVITTVFATSGRSSLMPRLWPIPRGALRTTEVIRLKYDISAALEMLHRSHIVHADVHADNLMLRAEPPCFVLIDYSGCTGDSVYPLHLGYGASGYGGVTHSPPTLESPRLRSGQRMATITAWLAPFSSSSTSARNHLREGTRTRTHPCPRTLTRSFAHGWKETNGLVRPAQHRRSPRAPGRTPPSPPQSFCMPHFGRRTGRSNKTRRPSPHQTPSSATPMALLCRRALPMTECRERAAGKIPRFRRDSS